MRINVRLHNRLAWDHEVENGNQWTIPVSSEAISAARKGDWDIFLTPTRPVPKEWFPDLTGCAMLCLASGGGQQGPLLAAAGARVTVLDNSPKQLAQDRDVAARERLDIRTIEADMADLSMFLDESFDLIVHPVSNVFAPDVHPVWREAYRVLRPGGSLLAGFDNPAYYLFDPDMEVGDVLLVKYKLPYSDIDSLGSDELRAHLQANYPLEFSHTLTDQIGGQIEAGFLIAGFYEDRYAEKDNDLLSRYMPVFIVTRAIKP